jgi:hypothetical protein
MIAEKSSTNRVKKTRIAITDFCEEFIDRVCLITWLGEEIRESTAGKRYTYFAGVFS